MDLLKYTQLPVIPLRNTLLLPEMTLPLRVGRERSIRAIECTDDTEMLFLAVSQCPPLISSRSASNPPASSSDTTSGGSDASGGDPKPEALYRVGTIAKIEHRRGSHENGYQIVARGLSRCRILEFVEKEGALFAKFETLPDLQDLDSETEKALLQSIQKLALEVLTLLPARTDALQEVVRSMSDLNSLILMSLANLELPLEQKQEIFENNSLKTRALKILEKVHALKGQMEVHAEIRQRLNEKLNKSQREHLLREQAKLIQEELDHTSGEGEEGSRKDDFRARIEAAGMPEEAKRVALEELRRLEAVGNASPESHVIRTYLETLCSLPWKVQTKDDGSPEEIDLIRAEKSLDEDHYGLEKVKRRILQQLAVIKLKRSTRGSILLLVGPPGVGKTSLGQSIARAMGRKYVRASLGGVRDEAEVRGHRRTYVGAMPGRILQAIRRVGVMNPVFVLDEVDKLGRGWAGDPSSALLEVLDPEQNQAFMDHYLDLPYDLSQCLFIATANNLENIPAPLLDRMEVIDLSGYTPQEKLCIAQRHLWPKLLQEHGIAPELVVLEEGALATLIQSYTREAGVRDLSRKLAGVVRHCAQKLARQEGVDSGDSTPLRIGPEMLEEALGPSKIQSEVAQSSGVAGVVTGLAWTPQGGEILLIEAAKMQGTGKLTITGQLGEIMKESAQIALSLVRQHLTEVAPGTEFATTDLHIHVPAGAIPKDGPSAGIALMTAFASLFSGIVVDPRLAMTGEITLRGAVMPVGGVREKVMAAHRAGVKTILLSSRNEKDVREVPPEIQKDLNIKYVDHASEVLAIALGLEVQGLTAKLPQSRSPRLQGTA